MNRLPHIIQILLLTTAFLLPGCSTTETSSYLTEAQDTERLYKKAINFLKLGRFETAIEYFKILETRYPFSPYALQTQLDLAYTYFLFARNEEAVSEIDRFLRFNPTHEAVPYAYYIRGLANFGHRKGLLSKLYPQDYAKLNQEHLRESFNDFLTLVQRYPNSKYAADAEQRLVHLRNVFASHEISVAEFYMSNEAWVAAINRAQNVLTDYHATPYTHQALVIMHSAYQKLQLEHQVADVEKVLTLNFPDDPYLNKKVEE